MPSKSVWPPAFSLTSSLNMLPTTSVWSHGCPHPPPDTNISLCGPDVCLSRPATPNVTYIADLSPCTKYKVKISHGGQNDNYFTHMVKTPGHAQVKFKTKFLKHLFSSFFQILVDDNLSLKASTPAGCDMSPHLYRMTIIFCLSENLEKVTSHQNIPWEKVTDCFNI